MMRRSLLLTKLLTLEWTEERLPSPAPDEVLIRTDSGSISIGSELPAYTGDERRSSPVRYQRMTGYESVGTVVGRGAGVEGVRVGDRVIGFYGHRTHGVVSEEWATPAPDGVSGELALLAILT